MAERLRRQRVEVLQKGLRDMARTLVISAAYLTDIEKGHRVPSEDLLRRMAVAYSLSEAELRAAWSRPEAIVKEIASQDAVTIQKVPQFLRTARHLSAEEWNAIITQARKMARKHRGNASG